MDAVSYSLASKQAQRIEKFIENPDSTSGILTQPSVIQAGETVSIPAGRTAVMANTVIDGTITLDGTMFIPSGATTDDIDAQLALKAPLENPAFTSAISTQGVNYKSTPVSVTSWSYVTTTITLNVASHTFVAGDHIEVSGLTSTTYPANGIHLVTSVTSTTIVFTLSATPTGTAGVSSATVKGYTTINGRVSEILGGNQTLLDVTANRVVGSTYYNTSGKPKIITANIVSNTAGSQAIITINGDNTYFGTTEPTALSGIGVFGIIPIGAGYSIINTLGVGTVNKWKEG